MAKLDENREQAILVTDDVTGLPVYLLVDPVTNRLLITVKIESGGGFAPTSAKIDENNTYASLAVDDTTGEARPLLTNANAELLVEIA